jgi:hypothetical protein
MQIQETRIFSDLPEPGMYNVEAYRALYDAVVRLLRDLPDSLKGLVKKVGIYYSAGFHSSEWGVEFIIGWHGRDIDKNYVQISMNKFCHQDIYYDTPAIVAYLQRCFEGGMKGWIEEALLEHCEKLGTELEDIHEMCPKLAGLDVQPLAETGLFVVEPKCTNVLFGDFLQMLEDDGYELPGLGPSRASRYWRGMTSHIDFPVIFVDYDDGCEMYRATFPTSLVEDGNNAPLVFDRSYGEQIGDYPVLVSIPTSA